MKHMNMMLECNLDLLSRVFLFVNTNKSTRTQTARKCNVNAVDCSSVLGSHVLVVLFVCCVL